MNEDSHGFKRERDQGDDDSDQWEAVRGALLTNFEKPDIEAAQILFACVAAHRITSHPSAWDMLMAPSGSMKTALLDTLQGLPSVHFVDEVTTNTFISGKLDGPGKKRKVPASLLHRIGEEGLVIIPDFSTILAMDNRKQPVILAQLRRIYDGSFSREFGTGEHLNENNWKGRITFLAGVTPDFDRAYSVHQSLGERFLKTRWPRAGGAEAALRAIRQESDTAGQIRSLVHEFLMPVLSQKEIFAPEMGSANEVALAHLSEFIVLARAHVPRSRYEHEILDEPQPEGNTRLPQQLAQIGRGWATLQGNQTVTSEGMKLIRRCAFDCLPPTRRAVLEGLIIGKNAYVLGEASVMASRALQDLRAVGLTVGDGHKSALSEKAIELISKAGLLSPKMV